LEEVDRGGLAAVLPQTPSLSGGFASRPTFRAPGATSEYLRIRVKGRFDVVLGQPPKEDARYSTAAAFCFRGAAASYLPRLLLLFVHLSEDIGDADASDQRKAAAQIGW
jgi:hypothetical protein